MSQLSEQEQQKIAREAMTNLILTLKLHKIDFYMLPKVVQESYIAVYLAGSQQSVETLFATFVKENKDKNIEDIEF